MEKQAAEYAAGHEAQDTEIDVYQTIELRHRGDYETEHVNDVHAGLEGLPDLADSRHEGSANAQGGDG